jgi:nucleotide-binding universal stress UspA family protein
LPREVISSQFISNAEAAVGKLKVMVAVRDAVSVGSLMTLACQLSQGMDADLMVLHVVDVPLVTPLDALDEMIDRAGKKVLAQAQHVAEKFPQTITTELLRAREVGEAIVGVAKERGVELLVMGHHKPHSHPLSETLLGGIVQYVAHHAPCRVVVQIPAPDRK